MDEARYRLLTRLEQQKFDLKQEKNKHKGH